MAYYRMIALILIWSFTFNSMALSSTGLPDSIHIPEEYGAVVDEYQGETDNSVVIIQDAHRYLDAQLNISSILNHLNTKNLIDMIGAEGAVNALPTSQYRSFPVIAARNEAALKFLKSGYFNGSEYYSITTENKHIIHGIEDAVLFEKNLEAFKAVSDRKKSITSSLETVVTILKQMSESIYNERLYLFEQKRDLFARGELDAASFFLELKQYARDIDWAAYPELKKLNSIITLGFLTNTRTSLMQKQALYDLIVETLSAQDAMRNEFISTYRNRIRENKEYFLLLTAKQLGIDTHTFSALENYVRYGEQVEKLDYSILSAELKTVAGQVSSLLAVTDRERELIRFSSYLSAVTSMIQLTATPDDVALAEQYSMKTFEPFLKENTNAVAYTSFKSAMEALPVQDASCFYSDARKREAALVGNMLNLMDTHNESSSAMVVGGFHAPGIKRELQKRGVSYVTVVPHIADGTARLPYEEKMTGGLFRTSELENNTITVAATEHYPQTMPAFLNQAKAELDDATLSAIQSLTKHSVSQFLQLKPQELQSRIEDGIYEQCNKLSKIALQLKKRRLIMSEGLNHALRNLIGTLGLSIIGTALVDHALNLIANVPLLGSFLVTYMVVSAPVWLFLYLDKTPKVYWDTPEIEAIRKELLSRNKSLLAVVHNVSDRTGFPFTQQITDIETVIWLLERLPVDDSSFIADSVAMMSALNVSFLRRSGCMDSLNTARLDYNTPLFVSRDIAQSQPHRVNSVIGMLGSIPSDIHYQNAIILRENKANCEALGIAKTDFLILSFLKTKQYDEIFVHELMGHNYFFDYIREQIKPGVEVDRRLTAGLLDLIKSTIRVDIRFKEVTFSADLNFLHPSIQELLEAQGYTNEGLKEIARSYNEPRQQFYHTITVSDDNSISGLSMYSFQWLATHHPKLFVALAAANLNHFGMDRTSHISSFHEIIAYALANSSRPAEFANATFMFDLAKIRQIIAQGIYKGWMWTDDKGWFSIGHPNELMAFVKSLRGKPASLRADLLRENIYFAHMDPVYFDHIVPVLNAAIDDSDESLYAVLQDYYFENMVWDAEAQTWKSTLYDGYVADEQTAQRPSFRPDSLRNRTAEFSLIDSSL
ncbi:MAG: hypothetical protein C4541_10755 [Candidatus Auribacter fodinae]|uniref:Uncharacterized protein n=1 Tax=Candidatus Auribacter fodinae TaxID=2093366 RepID=A0A3A4R2Y8_9BACT|nr:MAG: hypothetical protein C4541_10755 [Candidatus Auribacter fodinae]